MTDQMSARLHLPLMQPGQAQKEILLNEALTLIDLLAQPAVIRLGAVTPPPAPEPGQAWIVGHAPTGAWTGQADRIAGWSAGGWRFVAPVEGMSAWVVEAQQIARYSGSAWTIGMVRCANLTIAGDTVVGPRRPAIADVSGGGVIDVEGRRALAQILSALRSHGLIAT